MSYCIYQTEGIILSKKDVGEADRLLSILTKDFGRIDAMAQGVRYIKSKLRYSLNLFFHSRLGLVMVGNSWRVVDAEEISDWSAVKKDPKKIAVVFRLSRLVDRMVRGQEPDAILWNELVNVFRFLEKESPEISKAALRDFELLTGLRILSCFGYVADCEKWLNLSLEKVHGLESSMVYAIKKALQESQL